MPEHIRKLRLVDKLFATLPDYGIAIRGGGSDSGRILFLYKKELKEVKYIIDNDKNCKCSEFNIPVIPVTDIEKYPISTIILCSKRYEKEFRKESYYYPSSIRVVDIYQYLEDNGVIGEKSFFYFQPQENDYDVGFPFGK